LQGLLVAWQLPDEAFVEAAYAVAEQVMAEQSLETWDGLASVSAPICH